MTPDQVAQLEARRIYSVSKTESPEIAAKRYGKTQEEVNAIIAIGDHENWSGTSPGSASTPEFPSPSVVPSPTPKPGQQWNYIDQPDKMEEAR